MKKNTKTISSASTTDLLRELRQRERLLPKLLTKRERLLARIAELDGQLAELGLHHDGHVPRRRPQNSLKLSDALAQVLTRDEPLSVTQAADAVVKAGYKTNAANFRTIVNQALINDPRFKNIARGQYVLKKN